VNWFTELNHFNGDNVSTLGMRGQAKGFVAGWVLAHRQEVFRDGFAIFGYYWGKGQRYRRYLRQGQAPAMEGFTSG